MAEEAKMQTVETKPFEGQKPGTSGLRKKVVEFQKEHYLENFIQSTFDALPAKDLKGSTLVVAGDGRFWNKEASTTIIRMAAANGIKKIITGVNFLMSTPCVSSVIRSRKAYGGIILTASHNPGGPTEDFGVKYNISNGGPAPDGVTASIHKNTENIKEYKIAVDTPDIDFTAPGIHEFGPLTVEVVDAGAKYLELMKTIFDFPALRKFVARDDFALTFDSMHGVAGPFAKEIFIKELGLPETCCVNSDPKEDFGGGHPDPNLTYAHDLVEAMGLGEKKFEKDTDVPDLGAAADGDADRNMILGRKFFVTPSDSVAIIAANSEAIPYFKKGLKGVARSMPTSAALDRVAEKLKIKCYEVPTGWKYFGNLMDAGKLSICGEESFGTGSDHIREKDGVWAVLAWLSILQYKNGASDAKGSGMLCCSGGRKKSKIDTEAKDGEKSSEKPKMVTVEDVVTEHWKSYGRNYYTRYDYENVEKKGATDLMAHLVEQGTTYKSGETKLGEYTVKLADEFSYTDPVDNSVASHQGVRLIFTDGSRIVFRLSGTGSVGATIRLYVEKYDATNLTLETQAAVKELVDIALDLSKIKEFTGREKPTVIT